MKFKFVSLLLITIVVSCHQNEDYKIKYFSGFNTELKNTGEKVGPINHFLEPRSMVKMDSLIVISDFKTDSVFTIISLSTYNILDYGGLKGRGPGEFNSPDLSKRLFEKN
ncbi:MAG: hypothetical protein U5K32_09950 [Bacteroidales bacterium]|nr:hypothetical protein [Bacteroidales bacterium]